MVTRWSRRGVLAAAGALALAAARGRNATAQEIVRPASLGPSLPPELYRAKGDWPAAQGDLAATRRASGSAIDAGNAGELVQAWSFPVEASSAYGGMTATPIISGDSVYLQDMLSNVFALNRRTGDLRWNRRYDVRCAGPNGLAIGYGLLFGVLGDRAEVVALNAETGAERWRVRLSNNPGEGIGIAPLVYDSTVYVSTVAGTTTSFNRGGARGVLFALDAGTGATLWQFDTTTNNLWGNPRVNSGGGLWYPPSVDQAGGLYFGVANAGPWPGTPAYPNASSRAAPNDYASSAVALDLASGAVRWHYNAAPRDLFDHDFQNTPILPDPPAGDERNALALCSGKTGTVVAIRRETGEVMWETRVGIHRNNDLTALPNEPVEVFPGAWGGVLTPPALGDGRLYVPVVNHGTRYTAQAVDKASMFAFERAAGALACLDVADGRVRWELGFGSAVTAGALVVNDLVVTGALDGLVRLVDGRDGRLLRTIWAGAGINACLSAGANELIVAAAGPLVPSGDSAAFGDQQSAANVTCFTIGRR